MGLVDDMLGALSGGHGALNPQLTQIMGAIEGEGGIGLRTLVQRLEQGGLGPVVSSWRPDAIHREITPAQVREAIGEADLRAMASRAGVSEDEFVVKVSEHLPGLVSRMRGRPEEEV